MKAIDMNGKVSTTAWCGTIFYNGGGWEEAGAEKNSKRCLTANAVRKVLIVNCLYTTFWQLTNLHCSATHSGLYLGWECMGAHIRELKDVQSTTRR